MRRRNLSVFEVDFVADDHEREVEEPSRTRLYEEQIVPVVQLFERRRRCYVVDENAAVGTTEVAGAQTLKALLSSRVPYLR